MSDKQDKWALTPERIADMEARLAENPEAQEFLKQALENLNPAPEDRERVRLRLLEDYDELSGL